MQLIMSEVIGAIFQVILFALIPFIWWLVTARKKEKFLSWIGIRREKCLSSGLKTLILTLAATAAYILLVNVCIRFLPEGVTTAGSQFAGEGMKAIPAALAYAFIRTALSEEIVFRGFFLKRIAAKFGFAAGNTVQALLFGLLHGVPFGIATGSIAVTILMTLLPGAFGWFQGWLNEKNFKGSILPSWLLHGTINFITTILGL